MTVILNLHPLLVCTVLVTVQNAFAKTNRLDTGEPEDLAGLVGCTEPFLSAVQTWIVDDM